MYVPSSRYAPRPVALTDAATIATDAQAGDVFTVTIAGNRTLGNPTNLKDGGTYIWIVKQDDVGSRTLAFGSAFKFPGGVAPTITPDADAVAVISGVSDGASVYCNAVQDLG